MPGDDPNRSDRWKLAVEAFYDFVQRGGSTEQFLASHADLRDLLEPMLDEAATRAPQGGLRMAIPAAGTVLDDFRIVREIGRGGMGIVFEAEQISLHRRVALKVLPESLGLSRGRIEQFRREAAAAARLNHRGILPVYSVGESDGVHFFAMELIEGPSLAEVLVEARANTGARRRDTSSPRNLRILEGASPAAEVADIIAQVAEGIAEAHAHGVIHRDIKPQNILIDRRSDPHGSVRVVDFGIAKDLDRTTLSQTGDITGTPLYMSPEQVAGSREVDARSDVYSLGVVMYECLAFRAPFDGDSKLRIMHAVVNSDPRPLRIVDTRIPTDLEVLCAKAMEKNPRDRFGSIAEFAADLRRFLRHEPIHAQPPGAWTRLGKSIRRNRARASLVAMVILMVVLGVGGYFVHLEFSNRALVVEQIQTQWQRDRAVSYLRGAQAALNRLLEHVETMARRPGMESFHRQTTEDVVKYLNTMLIEDLGDSPEEVELILLAERARARLAKTYQWIGDHKAAVVQLVAAEKALSAAAERIPGDRRLAERRARLALGRGMILYKHAPATAVDEEFARALSIWRGLDASDQSPAEQAEQALGEAGAMYHRARLRIQKSAGGSVEVRRAMALLEAAESRVDSAADRGPERECLRLGHKITINRVALLEALGKHDVALALAERAVGLGRERIERFPQDPNGVRDLSISLVARASMLPGLGRVDEAIPDYAEATVLLRELVTGFPSRSGFQLELIRSLIGQAALAGRRHRPEEGLRLLAEAKPLLAAIGEGFGSDPVRLHGRCVELEGLLALGGEDLRTAREKLLAALRIQEGIVEVHPASARTRFDLVHTLHHLAITELRSDLEEEACDSARRALEEYHAAVRLNPDGGVGGISLHQLQGQYMEALIHHGDHEGAAGAARDFLHTTGDDGRAVLAAATNLAICARFARMDLALNEDEERRDMLVERYLKDAMGALRRAVKLGYRGAANLRSSPNFTLLRARPGFQALIEEVEQLRAARRARKKD